MASSKNSAQEAIRRQGDQKCPHHRGQNVLYKCNDCHKLACMTCVTTLHRRHDLDEICVVIPDVKHKIQNFIEAVERNDIPSIQEKIRQVKVNLSKNRLYYKNLISDIENRRDILKSELDDMTNRSIKSCRDLEQGNEELLLKQSTDLQTMVDELNAQINECKEALQSANNVLLYDMSNNILAKYKDVPVPEPSLANFTPGKLQLRKLALLLGEVTISKPKDESVKTLLKHQPPSRPGNWSVVSQFTPYEGYSVLSVCIAAANQIWVCLVNVSQGTCSNKLLLVDDKGNVQQTLDMDVSILNLCLHPSSKNIWFISCNDNTVREVTGSKSMVKFVKSKQRFTTDGDALSICICGEDSVYIGQKGEILLFTQRGDVLCRTTEGDTPLVRSPDRLAVCPVSGNLALVDSDGEAHQGKNESCIVILSPTLKLLYKYHGFRPGQQPSENAFNPGDVCYNSRGEVVISDMDNRSVILVNQEGDYLKTLYTDNEERTGVVCLQDSGDMYVSLWNDRMIVLKKE